MMGSAILNQVVNANQEVDPVLILQALNANVKANLQKQQKTDEHEGDGMDIALLKINFTNREIIFAGAKSPLYLVKNGELMYYKGSNISIGTKAKNRDKQFVARCIDVEGDEIIYLVTDGFQDQLGGMQDGKGRKKYMKTRFIDLLSRASQLPITAQKALLEKEFNDWKGDYPQTDDVMVIGFKIPPLPEKVSPTPLLARLTQFG
ncbi:MAG: SpoIIE family protein phosphatase [Microscillaceae bacterium]|nr:SpoIIE family protein phosphatase [Microscillaceae bacterium]